MDLPDIHYARTRDGVYLAYQTAGEGSVDVLDQVDWPGNLDVAWEQDGESWYRELASFSRLILHDRRGIGLSSRNVPLPNLETRVADTLTVLDDVGCERVVLTGAYEAGAANALLAATRPDRVRAMAWCEPTPRFRWAEDYPWGQSEEEFQQELQDLEGWGTLAYGQAFYSMYGADHPDQERAALGITKASRNACTPDVARALAEIWAETDIRDVLPAIKVPTLIMSGAGDQAERAAYVASLIPGAETMVLPGTIFSEENLRAMAEAVRRFVGAERPPPELDTVLSTVMFTDIVGSTERQATIGDQPGRRSCSATMPSSELLSVGGTASSWTRRAMASTRPSTVRLERSGAASRSLSGSASSALRSARGSIRANANWSTASSRASRSRSELASRRWGVPPRCSSPRP